MRRVAARFESVIRSRPIGCADSTGCHDLPLRSSSAPNCNALSNCGVRAGLIMSISGLHDLFKVGSGHCEVLVGQGAPAVAFCDSHRSQLAELNRPLTVSNLHVAAKSREFSRNEI